MIRSKTRWEIADLGPAGEMRAAELSKALALPSLVSRLLVRRGYDEPDKARNFLYGGIESLHDPFLLKGMSEAVDRIRLASERGERVRIYGDYDADGVSSTTLMSCLFNRLKLDFDHYIPHRNLEGYGLNTAAIDKAAEAGVTLIVTVDTGISAVSEITYARSKGIDVVVTDHHEPPHELPSAFALINPKQEDCPYPFKGLAGVGVAFKLAHALLGEPPVEWTDIVALGTIADLMPLTGENRILVTLGLERLRRSDKPGFRALADVSGIELASVNAVGVAFGMAPRINAAGRLDHADGAVRLLTAADDETAQTAAISVDTLNKERQRVVDAIVKDAQKLWEGKCADAAQGGMPEPAVIVLASEGWNAGVVGIVASKFIEKYYKPTLILGIDPDTGMCKGSARSIEGFDLHAALTACDELLDHYGGHQAAAGMSLHRDKLGELETALGRLAEEWLQPDDWIPKSAVDLTCTVEEVTLEVLDQLAQLEPFGVGNPAPKLLLQGGSLADRRTMGKESKHLKLSVVGDGKLLDAVGFGYGGLAVHLTEGAAVELVGEIALNEWNGQRRPQFMVHDLRVPHVQLFDLRREAMSDPAEALAGLIEEYNIAKGLVLVPSGAWRDVLMSKSFNPPPEGLALRTYDESVTGTEDFPALIVLGAPPSAVKLSEALKASAGVERVYALYGKSGRAAGESAQIPERDQFARLYQTLRRIAPITANGHADRLAVMLGYPAARLTFMLDVFEELDFIVYQEGELRLVESPAKKDLSHSARYRDAARRLESDRILFAPAKEFAEWVREEALSSPLQINEGVGIS